MSHISFTFELFKIFFQTIISVSFKTLFAKMQPFKELSTFDLIIKDLVIFLETTMLKNCYLFFSSKYKTNWVNVNHPTLCTWAVCLIIGEKKDKKMDKGKRKKEEESKVIKSITSWNIRVHGINSIKSNCNYFDTKQCCFPLRKFMSLFILVSFL